MKIDLTKIHPSLRTVVAESAEMLDAAYEYWRTRKECGVEIPTLVVIDLVRGAKWWLERRGVADSRYLELTAEDLLVEVKVATRSADALYWDGKRVIRYLEPVTVSACLAKILERDSRNQRYPKHLELGELG